MITPVRVQPLALLIVADAAARETAIATMSKIRVVLPCLKVATVTAEASVTRGLILPKIPPHVVINHLFLLFF